MSDVNIQKNEGRDSAIIYRSFYEAIIELPDKNQAEIWKAIFEYSLNFNLIELSGLSKTIFTLIKPQLDANIQRYKNGKKAKSKQSGSETKANNKQTGSETGTNENKNKNKNPNLNEKGKNTPPAFEEFLKYAKEKCPDVSKESVRLKYDAWKENDWHTSGKNSHKIKKWKSTLLNTLDHLKKETPAEKLNGTTCNIPADV